LCVRGQCRLLTHMVVRHVADTLVGFFFQAEDGIRDWSVTGVQTCALPISAAKPQGFRMAKATTIKVKLVSSADTGYYYVTKKKRSEERRVGKECRSRGAPDH